MKLNKKFLIFLGGLLLTSVVFLAFLLGERKKDYVGEPNRDYIIEDIKVFDDNKFVFASNKKKWDMENLFDTVKII